MQYTFHFWESCLEGTFERFMRASKASQPAAATTRVESLHNNSPKHILIRRGGIFGMHRERPQKRCRIDEERIVGDVSAKTDPM